MDIRYLKFTMFLTAITLLFCYFIEKDNHDFSYNKSESSHYKKVEGYYDNLER